MKAIRIIGMLTLTGALFFLAAAHVGAAQALRHASGGGFFVLQSGSGEFNDMMFSFTARLMDEQGNAKGQFEQHNLSIGGIVHLEIVYMEFENNNVWLIGEVTKSINTNANIGELRAVRLQDNGEGRNEALDMRSKLYKGPYTFPLPDYPLMVLDGGNIQIRWQVKALQELVNITVEKAEYEVVDTVRLYLTVTDGERYETPGVSV